jgi:ABC-type transporter Mla subunit MlaD
MKTEITVLADAMRILSDDIQSPDGVANAAILEASHRLIEQNEQIEHLLEMLEKVIAVAVDLGQELQDFIDEGEEAGSEMSASKDLLNTWNEAYKVVSIYE